ncbi:hypothetical protein EI555_011944, partial [Monodon monoceros]
TEIWDRQTGGGHPLRAGLSPPLRVRLPGTGAEKSGPTLEVDLNCTQECLSDGECADNLKCCWAGCATVCQMPNEKQGSCSKLDIACPQLSLCLNHCQVRGKGSFSLRLLRFSSTPFPQEPSCKATNMSRLCLSIALLVLLGTLVACTPGGEPSNQAQVADPVDGAVITILITDPEPVPVPAALRPAFCLEPPYTGPCRALFIRYFYNAKSGLCETFAYGGCRRKQNNFLDKEDCNSTCGGRNRARGKKGSRAGWEGKVWGKRWSSGGHTPFTPAQCLFPLTAAQEKWLQCPTYPPQQNPASFLTFIPLSTITALLGGGSDGSSGTQFRASVVAEDFSIKKPLFPTTGPYQV